MYNVYILLFFYKYNFMDSVSLKTYAKINIGLDITGKREDGYHLLKTCMQTIDIFDEITVSRLPAEDGPQIKITSDNADVPHDRTNIAWKAAALIKEKYGISDRVSIFIKKSIPMAAGLAGGSTDGAAVIKAMDSLFGLKMSLNDMDGIAVRLGADVPFCLRQGLWLCEGIGEVLAQLPAIAGVCAVIAKPHFAVSTKWCYETYDSLENVRHPDMDRLISALEAENKEDVFACIGNVLEAVSCPAHPEIDEMKELMLAEGARCACMSGSGGTVFGLFTDRKKAEEACRAFKTYPAAESVFAADFVYQEN